VRATSVGAIQLRAPAKLNLGLRVVGIREDGYHLIESVFAPIDLCDELEIELLPGGSRIELEVGLADDSGLPEPLASVPAGPENLVFRAAEALRDAWRIEGRIRMQLRKRIPAAAGLGGGSSNAAAALLGLASLAPVKGSSPGIDELALALGADVPFFLAPAPSLVSGIGERIDPLDGLPALDLVVANPGISLATAEVYRASDALGRALTQPGAGSTMRAFSSLCRARDEVDLCEALGELLVNDLEPAAIRLCPPVGRLIERLREAGAVGVGMTGSGATVFGVFASRRQADRAAASLRKRGEIGRRGSESEAAWVRVTRLLDAAQKG
jgi:4-diphosphocytidyl-2-C-methyl-D-erythritol kinase